MLCRVRKPFDIDTPWDFRLAELIIADLRLSAAQSNSLQALRCACVRLGQCDHAVTASKFLKHGKVGVMLNGWPLGPLLNRQADTKTQRQRMPRNIACLNTWSRESSLHTT